MYIANLFNFLEALPLCSLWPSEARIFQFSTRQKGAESDVKKRLIDIDFSVVDMTTPHLLQASPESISNELGGEICVVKFLMPLLTTRMTESQYGYLPVVKLES